VIRTAHWTPRYLKDRALAYAYEWTHPRAPWFTRYAVRLLEHRLQPEHAGLEWGSGRSTLWLAQRTARLISIEHDPGWYDKARRGLATLPNPSATVLLRTVEPPAYLEPCNALDDGLLDYVVVDGARRGECALAAIPKLRSGGTLVIDDIHRYLPSGSHAPNALPPGADLLSPVWRDVRDALAQWPCEWTSDGVRDTALFTKP